SYCFGSILLQYTTPTANYGCWFRIGVLIKRSGWGHWYLAARGEILRPAQDGRKRKHLPRMFSLIKNESWRFEDDQIPS
uniref:Uncharacterized protein n=1 Tax=Cyprinodon variegatus TaxID=28743 RepID=A0A3Q2GGR5_CYPVA